MPHAGVDASPSNARDKESVNRNTAGRDVPAPSPGAGCGPEGGWTAVMNQN
jgi:hypothetical protein